MRVVNVFDDAPLAADAGEPDGYRAAYAELGPLVGGDRLGAGLLVLREDEAVCPYHYELAEEEWLVVLEGTPSVRRPDGTHVYAAGDVVIFPRGPEGAHKVFNAAPEPARVMLVSERAETTATVYPDSDKVGVYATGERLLFRRADAVGYYDGEPLGPQQPGAEE